MKTKRVVIVGGGFGGLQVAKKLGNAPGIEVTLLDRRNHHLFQPLLYQVAMAGLSPNDIAIPIRSLLSGYSNTRVFLANVEKIDLDSSKLITDAGVFEFDYLVLACGAKHSYFGRPEWEKIAPGLKTIEQATEIRRRVLQAFEEAEREKDSDRQAELLRFVVIGGGPTGVELAGAIGELSRFTLARDFRRIDPQAAEVVLIEGGERILASFHPSLSQKAVEGLSRLGVRVLTQTRVTDLREGEVSCGDQKIRASTILWAAGVQPSTINEQLPAEKDSQGRVKVLPDLSLSGYPHVFVIGDQATLNDKNGNPLPGVAPVAIQQGSFVARLISVESKRGESQPRPQFKYIDKGQMATIGRKLAVLEVGKLRLSGFIAWAAWLFVHIYYLIGFKNRLFVFLQWAWHYVSYGRGARLIVHKEWRSYLNNQDSDPSETGAENESSKTSK